MTYKIIIASLNPVKIESVKQGFSKMFLDFDFECQGVAVPSEVNDQPIGTTETLQGAMNRCRNAKAKIPNADFWVGIEGGIEKNENEMSTFAWIVIQSINGFGKSKTGTLFLPPQVVKLVNQGIELGEADDIVFGGVNSKQKGGAAGILTGGVIDRTKLYVDGVVLALIPFKNKNIYQEVSYGQ